MPSLSNGTYEVWVHNGHGGHYGWSGPLTLTVWGGYGWTSTQFNVKTGYGAYGDGVHDDTVAINNAIQAAGGTPYSTVYFPAGTYEISDGFIIPNNTRLQGAGKSATIVQCGSNFVVNSSDPRNFAVINENGAVNVTLQDMTWDANNNMNVNHNMPNIIWERAVYRHLHHRLRHQGDQRQLRRAGLPRQQQRLRHQ